MIEAIVVKIVDIVTTEAAISDFVNWIVNPWRRKFDSILERKLVDKG